MRALITTELIRKLPPGPCDIRDTKVQGFVVRVRPSGTASYLVAVGRGCWHTIGKTSKMAVAEARALALGVIGDASKQRAFGGDPIKERKRAKAMSAVPTFKAFIDKHYEPWALEHQKRGQETVKRLRSVFSDFEALRLADLTPWTVEKWRTARLKRSPAPKPATVNSHITMLKAALQKAVTWNLLPTHPIVGVKPLMADRTGRIRFLSDAEETRLRQALRNRDAARRERRAQANEWRRQREYELWPEDNGDHVTPIVLLALNTGLRKGEIFGLKWRDVNLGDAMLTVRGDGAKSGQTRYVPLNTEAVTVLEGWQSAGATDDVVFPGRGDGEPLDDIKKGWAPIVKAAKLEAFTFHDLRHTFASKLVMAGVDLNTVRELLGHGDIKMTLRYAHLAPEHKAAAVEKLCVAAG